MPRKVAYVVQHPIRQNLYASMGKFPTWTGFGYARVYNEAGHAKLSKLFRRDGGNIIPVKITTHSPDVLTTGDSFEIKGETPTLIEA